MIPKQAIVIHRSLCINYRINPDMASGLNHCPRHNLHAFGKNNISRNYCRWMNNVGELVAPVSIALKQAGTMRSIPNRTYSIHKAYRFRCVHFYDLITTQHRDPQKHFPILS